MKDISEVMELLKEIRRKRSISVSKVAAYIEKETGIQVSSKTIYGWEEGNSKPDVMCFMAMCNLYGIENASALFVEGSTIQNIDTAMRDKLYKAYLAKPEMQEAAHVLLGIK